MQAEAGSDLTRDVGRHLFQRRHPQDAMPSVSILAVTKMRSEYHVGLIRRHDNVDDLLVR